MNKLIELCNKNTLAETIFTAFALRQRNRKVLNLETFRRVLEEQGVSINPREFVDIFKTIETEQLGKLLITEKGLYFKSSVALRAIGFEALQETPFSSGETRDRSKKSIPIVRIA